MIKFLPILLAAIIAPAEAHDIPMAFPGYTTYDNWHETGAPALSAQGQTVGRAVSTYLRATGNQNYDALCFDVYQALTDGVAIVGITSLDGNGENDKLLWNGVGSVSSTGHICVEFDTGTVSDIGEAWYDATESILELTAGDRIGIVFCPVTDNTNMWVLNSNYRTFGRIHGSNPPVLITGASMTGITEAGGLPSDFTGLMAPHTAKVPNLTLRRYNAP